MWLINAASLELENFQQCPANNYATLSHTWGSSSDELTFEEFKAGQGRQKPGFRKIQLCCEQARRDGLQYAWVDTCCIDKRSSTELSEAINSMFNWYQSAKLCYVYLSDVDDHNLVAPDENSTDFLESRWFRRGWTLQELIAPQCIVFYNREWTFVGDRSSLAHDLHTATRIALEVLTSEKSFRSCSIAQRMSWASNRQTTRPEDIAYCLIGLFDVNMPLLYGEGRKAFKRLQEEIIRQTNDETIFAWTESDGEESGLFALDPTQFAGSANIRRKQEYDYTPHSMTPGGLQLECQMLPWEMNTYVVLLQCEEEVPDSSPKQIAMFICKTSDDLQYRRIPYHGSWLMKSISFDSRKAAKSRIFVRDIGALPPVIHGGLPLVHIESKLYACHLPAYRSQMNSRDASFDTVSQLKFSSQNLEEGCVIALSSSVGSSWTKYRYHMELGFDRDFRPTCILYPTSFMVIPAWCPRIIAGFIFTSCDTLPTVGNLWSDASHECQLAKITGSGIKMGACQTCHDRITTRSNIQIAPFSFTAMFLNHRKTSVIRRATGTRTLGLEFSHSPTSLRASKCVEIRISFKHLSGLNWCFSINERPLHSKSHYGGFCFVCLKPYFKVMLRISALLTLTGMSLFWPMFFFIVRSLHHIAGWLNDGEDGAYNLCVFIIFSPLLWFLVQWLLILLFAIRRFLR